MSMHRVGVGASMYAGTFTPDAQQTSRQQLAPPTCLTAAQVTALLPCFTGKVPAGMTAQQAAALCAAANSLPYCPDTPRAKIPDCLDANWLSTLTYCEKYPNYGGPKPMMNALCWAAKKDPVWYGTVKARPACGTAAPPFDEHGNPPGWVDPDAPPARDRTLDEQTLPPVDTAPPAETPPEHKPNYALWGGLLALLVVGGGGAYYYVKKHK